MVRLVDVMGDDSSIVQAARVSYGKGTKSPEEDAKLIRYLMKNGHTSPFEMVEFKFHIKVPIFIARQWHRHRTASINEISARYTEVKEEFYVPKVLRGQAQGNKQGSEGLVENGGFLIAAIEAQAHNAYLLYRQLLRAGVAREQARMVLPQSIYTEFYWKIDLHNLFGFLRQRLDMHAQAEIREEAEAIAEIVKKAVPIAYSAFEEYRRSPRG